MKKENENVLKIFESDGSILSLEREHVDDGYQWEPSNPAEAIHSDPHWVDESYNILSVCFLTRLENTVLKSSLVSLFARGSSHRINGFGQYRKFLGLVYDSMKTEVVIKDLRNIFASQKQPLISDQRYFYPYLCLLSQICERDFEGNSLEDAIKQKEEPVYRAIASLNSKKQALRESLKLLPENKELEAKITEIEKEIVSKGKIRDQLKKDLSDLKKRGEYSSEYQEWIQKAGTYVTSFFPEAVANLGHDSVQFKGKIKQLYQLPRIKSRDTREGVGLVSYDRSLRAPKFDIIDDVVKKSIKGYSSPKLKESFEKKLIGSWEKNHDLRGAKKIISQYVPADCRNKALGVLQQNYDIWRKALKKCEIDAAG